MIPPSGRSIWPSTSGCRRRRSLDLDFGSRCGLQDGEVALLDELCMRMILSVRHAVSGQSLAASEARSEMTTCGSRWPPRRRSGSMNRGMRMIPPSGRSIWLSCSNSPPEFDELRKQTAIKTAGWLKKHPEDQSVCAGYDPSSSQFATRIYRPGSGKCPLSSMDYCDESVNRWPPFNLRRPVAPAGEVRRGQS